VRLASNIIINKYCYITLKIDNFNKNVKNMENIYYSIKKY